MRSLTAIIEELDNFSIDQSDEGDYEERLYELLNGLAALPGGILAVPAMFSVLERYPLSDFGSPGPIVHTIEAIGDYEQELRASLMRQPTYLSVWMVNRILNTELTNADRLAWLEVLRDASTHPTAPARAKEDAVDFLRYQGGA